ncbi:MAG: hypothetical protein LBL83_06775 [Clostridiales bacterium]|jgi:hypothetical protein|nr:hypothetical protein [Clostridiales bacterium]
MERWQTKKILLFCRDIDGEIAIYRRILQDFEDIYCAFGGGRALDGMPRGRRKISRPTESAALNVPEGARAAMRDLRARIDSFAALKAAVLQELSKLPLQQKRIVYDFHMSGLRWARISEREHYSVSQCKNIRNRGLDSLGEGFSKNGRIAKFNCPD